MRTIRRRRLQKKTDYKARFALLKSEMPRLVIRKSNRYITAQIVSSKIAQDSVLVSLNSQILLKKGWPKEKLGSLKNLAAAYILGFLVAKESLKKGVKEAILDFGMHRNIHKSRIYAVLKGAIDSGLNVSHDSKILPTIEDIKKSSEFSPIIEKIIGEKNI
jgi:large subunit ribosomal protein L18